MTPKQLRERREALGLSHRAFARAVGMTGKHANRHVRAWEKGAEDIPDWLGLELDRVEAQSQT